MKKSNIIYYIATFLVFTFLFSIDVYAYCPLGADVTKDLYGVLMILKIIAPLLCIALSIFDAIKAVAKGDPASDLKNVAKKFGKRMLYAIILFFLPVIVDQVFRMTDIWDANGTCDLFNPTDIPELTNKTDEHTYEHKKIYGNGYTEYEIDEKAAAKYCDYYKNEESCDGVLFSNYQLPRLACYWENDTCLWRTVKISELKPSSSITTSKTTTTSTTTSITEYCSQFDSRVKCETDGAIKCRWDDINESCNNR